MSEVTVKAFCPDCRITQLKYALGDVHVCPDCNKSWFTHQVIDKDGFYLLEECPTHGLEHGGYTYAPTEYDEFNRAIDELKLLCIQCQQEFVKVPLLRYTTEDGIARQMQTDGDKFCKYRFRCTDYNKKCTRCPNAWESKYKPLSKSKIRKMVESSRKRLTMRGNIPR